MWGVWIYDNSDNRDNNDNCEMCMSNGINIDRRVKSERIRLIRILEIMASDEKLNTDFTDIKGNKDNLWGVLIQYAWAKCKEKRNYEPQTYTNPTSYTLSYTQSYTRNHQ